MEVRFTAQGQRFCEICSFLRSQIGIGVWRVVLAVSKRVVSKVILCRGRRSSFGVWKCNFRGRRKESRP